GSIQTIRWSYTGNPGPYVKVELLEGGVVNRIIKSFVSKGTGGSGSCNWTIPANLAPGTDYRIRVTSINGAYTDTSDSDFIIAAPTITVASPNGEETLTAGMTQTIRWTYTGNSGAYVKIELLKGGVVNRIIKSLVSKGTAGSGSCTWRIPLNQVPGNDYQIRVSSTSNHSYSDTSDTIFIISK
ncbi:MAG: Ser-Thr-rich GPI-anchored membrane family protein, partial [Thermodesulfobacteriota bacterium]